MPPLYAIIVCHSATIVLRVSLRHRENKIDLTNYHDKLSPDSEHSLVWAIFSLLLFLRRFNSFKVAFGTNGIVVGRKFYPREALRAKSGSARRHIHSSLHKEIFNPS